MYCTSGVRYWKATVIFCFCMVVVGGQGREQKTTRTKGHYIKQAAQIGNRVKNSSVTMPRQIPDLTLNATSML